MQKRSQEILERLTADGHLRALAVSETGFAFDPRTGQSFTINHTGIAALELLRQGRSLGEAAGQLAQRYHILSDLAESCLESFLQQLGRHLS